MATCDCHGVTLAWITTWLLFHSSDSAADATTLWPFAKWPWTHKNWKTLYGHEKLTTSRENVVRNDGCSNKCHTGKSLMLVRSLKEIFPALFCLLRNLLTPLNILAVDRTFRRCFLHS